LPISITSSWITTGSLALENNLIKQHKPKFNVLLRDDKTYPYIRFTAFEKFHACMSRAAW